jgi:hypothetical protein
MYEIEDLALTLLLLLLLMYWWGSGGHKIAAVKAARAYCADRGLQLLDDTLAFRSFRMQRNSRNQRRLCRIYQFEYCFTGADRHLGEIVLCGYSVLRVILHGGALEITEYDN